MLKKMALIFTLAAVTSLFGCAELAAAETPQSEAFDKKDEKMTYFMPAENLPHEGTWLTWPHKYTYGEDYQKELEGIWVQMTQALCSGEKLHIIAYDADEQLKIEKLLLDSGVNDKQFDFVIAHSDDVWVRDTGPIFVFDENDRLTIANFGFDGWGEKVDFDSDDQIPVEAAMQKNLPIVDVSDFVLEGGSIEMDNDGTLIATKSSVVSKNRNPSFTIKKAEEYLSKYLGATNFIWLSGVMDEDITDAHIDGIARFFDDSTLLTVSKKDFAELYENIDMADYSVLQNAKNASGEPYKIVTLPLTKKNVKGLTYKGSYLNYYIGNEVVLLPVYNDENDAAAIKIVKALYPTRKIVPIDVTALFQYGGMLHCVTQQQPVKRKTSF